MTGFIATHREMLNHPLFKGRADRLGAWSWLLMSAAWKQTKFDVNGQIVTIERGQISTSIRHLAEAWGWSKSTTQRFLTRLKTDTMIGTDSGTGRLLITICNYEKYQSISEGAGTASGTASGTAAGQQRDIKEQGNKETSIISSLRSDIMHDENDENQNLEAHGKNELTTIPAKPKITQSEIDQAVECWNLGSSKAGWEKIRKLTPDRRSKLIARLSENGIDGWKQALRRALRSETLGHDPPQWFNFKFLIKNSDNILNLLEGNYDRKFSNGSQTRNANTAGKPDWRDALGEQYWREMADDTTPYEPPRLLKLA